jgi:hypothetical protein
MKKEGSMGVGKWLCRLLGAPTPSETNHSHPELLPSTSRYPIQLPDGSVLTDDMTIALPPGRAMAELVDMVIRGGLADASSEEIEGQLSAEFGLSADDAALARDRAFGGLFRAGTGNPANRPSENKDPVAWESYQRGLREPLIVSRIFRK